MPKHNSTSFTAYNEASLRHGGRAAQEALAKGEPFTGLAADTEEQITQLFEEVGRVELIKRGAIRLETVAELYYNAFKAAAEANEIEKLDNYANRFRQLQQAALSAWSQVGQEEAKEPNTLNYEDIVKNEHNNLGTK